MHFFEGRRSSRTNRMIWQGSDQSNSEGEGFKSNQNIQSADWLTDLYGAKDKMIEFIDGLGPLKETELREDVMSHCQSNLKNQKIYDCYISSEMICKIINIRIEKMIKNKRIKKNWSEEDVKILIWLISKYSDLNNYQDVERDIVKFVVTQDDQDWEFMATLIPGVTAQSCMFKWLSLKKVNLATNNWSQEESILLGNIVREQAKDSRRGVEIKDWKSVSQKLYKLNTAQDKIFRNAKQCRQHWNCYLNPNLKKGPWKPEEDIKLLKRIQQNKGSKKWSQIVKDFDGRTENALKNRYTLIIDKQKKHHRGRSQLELVQDYLQKCYVEQFTTVIKTDSGDENERHSVYSYDDMNQKVEEEFPVYDYKKQQRISECKNENRQPEVKLEPQQNMPSEKQVPKTPVRIQKFKFENFSAINKSEFLKLVKPGVINSDGSFVQIKDRPFLRKAQSLNV